MRTSVLTRVEPGSQVGLGQHGCGVPDVKHAAKVEEPQPGLLGLVDCEDSALRQLVIVLPMRLISAGSARGRGSAGLVALAKLAFVAHEDFRVDRVLDYRLHRRIFALALQARRAVLSVRLHVFPYLGGLELVVVSHLAALADGVWVLLVLLDDRVEAVHVERGQGTRVRQLLDGAWRLHLLDAVHRVRLAALPGAAGCSRLF